MPLTGRPGGEMADLRARWRELGFAETAQSLATFRPAPTEALPRSPESMDPPVGSGLPRISVDLQSTVSGWGEAGRGGAARGPQGGGPDLSVLGVLGEGGMGRVLLARQRSLDREVALKTLHPGAQAQHRDALVFEGAVTGFLEHPSIIPVHALGVSEDGRPVLVMKRVDGVAWSELLRDPTHAAWEGWAGDPGNRLEGHLEILMQVCNAVHFAHMRGVVHRDIKPQNVLIGRFGDVYLADWGIAHRLGGPGGRRLCGTPGYMAPEMAMGFEVDPRTDVYLLGATLHELLTGRPRHDRAEVTSVLDDAIASPPVAYADAVPPELARLANEATARDPEARPSSAAAFRKAIADHLRHKSSLALSASAMARLAKLRDLAGDAADADQLLAETRFALDQALAQWPGNPSALRAQGELEALLAARRARAAELEHLARDLDPTVSLRQRTAFLAAMAVAAVAVATEGISHGLRYQPSGRELFWASLVPVGVVASMAVLLRRHLRRSARNRQTAVGLMVAVSAVTVERLVGLRTGLSGSAMVMHDSLLLATLTAFAVVHMRAMAGVAAILLAAAVVGALAPPFAYLAFSLATSAAILLGVRLAWRGDGRA